MESIVAQPLFGMLSLLRCAWSKDVNGYLGNFSEYLHLMDGRTNLFRLFFLHGNKSYLV